MFSSTEKKSGHQQFPLSSLSSSAAAEYNESSNLVTADKSHLLVIQVRYRFFSKLITCFLFSCSNMFWSNCCKRKEFSSRNVLIGRENLQCGTQKFPPNVIRNQKYSILTFIPIVSRKIIIQTGTIFYTPQ